MPQITLRAARANKGLSQKEAAKALNVSTKTISFWENYKRIPNTKHANAICALYGCTYDEIIFFRDSSLLANKATGGTPA